MKGLRDTLVHWVDTRTKNMLATPRAWGSDEAVEMQILLLLQVRALALRPELEIEAPGRLVDAYLTYLTKAYPQRPHRPLHQIVEADRLGLNLAAELRKVVDIFTRQTLAENPFQHHELAIRLVFEQGRTPATSAVTGYYEEFRRAARAVARPGGKTTGRATKGIENATDFALSDVRVTPKNDAPAEALLLLGPARGPAFQRDYLVETQVRDAVANLVAMGEWAGSSTTADHVPIDNVDQRNRVAVQALRVLPRRGLAKVEIGGALIGRSMPVEFRPEHERRFVDVIGATAPSEPFDQVEEIRGLDLDRGVVILDKKQRLLCYARPEMLGDVAMVGVAARVCGRLYRPLTGRPFVLADLVDPVEGDEEEDPS